MRASYSPGAISLVIRLISAFIQDAALFTIVGGWTRGGSAGRATRDGHVLHWLRSSPSVHAGVDPSRPHRRQFTDSMIFPSTLIFMSQLVLLRRGNHQSKPGL